MASTLLFTVDIGNTRTKLGVWRILQENAMENLRFSLIGDAIQLFEFTDTTNSFENVEYWLDEFACGREIKAYWIVSSVNAGQNHFLKNLVAKVRPNDFFKVLKLADIPIEVVYDYPEKLGVDRVIAAYAGGGCLEGKNPFLVVDVGTAATVDYVNGSGIFLGGAILPGARLMAKALSVNTANLPMLNDLENENLSLINITSCKDLLIYPATETHKAIRLGVIFTLIGAIMAFYWKIRRQFLENKGNPDCLTLVLAGGDAAITQCNIQSFFDDLDVSLGISTPRPKMIVEPCLVLRGLKGIACLKDNFFWIS